MTGSESKDKTLYIDADQLLPGISVDCVVFGFHEGVLKILLNKMNDYDVWMIPGGFVFKNENVNDAATRILASRTGLSRIYLRQFYTFGNTDRTDIEQNKAFLEKNGITSSDHWFARRFVSIGYFAFVDYSKVHINTAEYEQAQWFDLDDIPQLYSDHNEIINKALSVIRQQINNIPIGYQLLPEKFTATELRIIYETILNKKLDRRNFQKKMMLSGLVYKLDEVSKKWGVKSSALFSFDKEKYKRVQDGDNLFFDF